MNVIRLGFVTLVSSALLAALAPSAQAEPDVADPTAAVLDQANGHRARHSAPPLVADARLAQGAQAWADRGVLEHSSFEERDHAGETLYKRMSPDPLRCDERVLRQAVDTWYSEIDHYDYNTPGFSSKTGNFTQLVWKSTERVGVGIAATREENGWHGCMVVGRFDPPGNYVGRFEENVLPPNS
ncbi:CAP family protein [Nocardiopsis lucentensis]|uniref:CAP family protein n=1 Tax=Nocardiopsis lucentensis TaxID=53441 RepID=UPI0003495F59|nr:CAP family protein [Nocardiopsis lucentensis]